MLLLPINPTYLPSTNKPFRAPMLIYSSASVLKKKKTLTQKTKQKKKQTSAVNILQKQWLTAYPYLADYWEYSTYSSELVKAG